MFSKRARRGTETSQHRPNTGRSISPALASPLLPWPNSDRPASAGDITKGPPILPPLPLIATQTDSSLALDFSKPLFPEKSTLHTQRSYEHFSRPRSAASPAISRAESPALSLPLRQPMSSPVVTTHITPLRSNPPGRVGRAISGPTMVLNPMVDSDESPKMEASVFPTYTNASPQTDSSPIMDREFIDSRDRPYSQPRVKAQPAKKASTIGISFESTSAAYPAPQLVTTRPKTQGSMSTIAGVQVPTHHTSSLRPDKDRRITKLLNPMALLNRKKAATDTNSIEEEERKSLMLAQARQKTVATVGIDKLPDDFDPRIRGKIVHDFSAPRRRLDAPSPVSPLVREDDRIDRRSTHTPVFVEHLEQSRPDGVAAENRENKDFLVRFSHQSGASTFSQESAILPPFARRSQTIEPVRSDDTASWSSGRDSGGISSSGPRESGISSFSAVSPITRNSDIAGFPAYFGLPPSSPIYEDTTEGADDLTRPRSHSESTAREVPDSKVDLAKQKSNASRFSFQISSEGTKEEQALESKFKPSAATLEDDEDYFDEDAMNDMDELEMENDIPLEDDLALRDDLPLRNDLQRKNDLSLKNDLPLRNDTTPKPMLTIPAQTFTIQASSPTKSPASDFYSDAPYVPNERELTYAEHPLFKSAFADSRRESSNSAFLDNYLGDSPTSPQRGSSLKGTSPAPQARATSNLTGAPLVAEETPKQEPITPVSQHEPVDSAFSSFRFSDSPDVHRADSAAKPHWDRTANLWKVYKNEEDSSAPQVAVPSTSARPNDARGAYFKGVRVRKPSGSSRQSRLSQSSRLQSIDGQNEDMYYDDGQFDHEDIRTKTIEADIDRLPIPDRGEKDYRSLLPKRQSSLPATAEEPPIILQAYHQALADAATRAEAEGRFTRQPIIQNTIAEVATPGKMGFDFGFDDPVENHDWDDLEDDIVAAANAEALANDPDGFYGSEFGFYAHARPGAGAEVQAINGGFFGEEGDDGLTRKRSVKEPNLTPITERSEFSTRNSFVNLVGLANSTITSPVLARMSVDAFGENDISTFEQLKQLRKSAFGGSNASLGSQPKASPTSQHFPGSIPMALAYSTGSSSSGDRYSPQAEQAHRSADPLSHSRTGSGTDSVTYVREEENGQPRWIIERRRLSPNGQIEIAREPAEGWI